MALGVTYYDYWGTHGDMAVALFWYTDEECTDVAFRMDATLGYSLGGGSRRVFFTLFSGSCTPGNTYYAKEYGSDTMIVGVGDNALIRVACEAGAVTDATGIGTLKWNNDTDSLYETTDGAGTYTPSKTDYTFSPTNVTFTNGIGYASEFTATYTPVPSKPINPTPSDAADDVTLDQATITWEDGGNATSYNVYYGDTSGDLTLLESSTEDLSYTISGITLGSPFDYIITRYWRIDAVNAYGTTTGDEWSFTTIRFDPPKVTYWYSTGGYYYQLLVQDDGTYGDPPPDGTEDTDYVILGATYLPNFIRTQKKLVAAANNKIWYETT